MYLHYTCSQPHPQFLLYPFSAQIHTLFFYFFSPYSFKQNYNPLDPDNAAIPSSHFNLILLRQGPCLALELAISARLALNSPSSWNKAICHHTDHCVLLGVQGAPRFLSRMLCSKPAASRWQQTVIKPVV